MFRQPQQVGVIETRVIGRTLDHLDHCGSTNDVARAAAEHGAPDGHVVLADTQTAGRGQRGRVWLAEPDACVLLSIVLRPTIGASEAGQLTMLAACAAAQTIDDASEMRSELKWPNDVILNGRKICGILLETSLMGDDLEYAIVGIGLNVNLNVDEHPEIVETATSLLRETGRPIDRLEIARSLLMNLDARYQRLRETGAATIFEEWKSRLGTTGRTVELDDGSSRQIVAAETVLPDGALVVRRSDGSQRTVHFGEVSLRNH